ncbi:hypothetical protein AVEN_83824-1 [Araneus ventricosus]|uniref:Uncharacterized protein n=1 Tax=Araneus ventricosus TaxID=182803 RepID=A0A4Y2RK87_ARAVE|nr:hypothetical protein AVEN_83824-1 [Araneus ventricosus]
MRHYIFRLCSLIPYKDKWNPFHVRYSLHICLLLSFAGVHHLLHRKIQWGLTSNTLCICATLPCFCVHSSPYIQRSNGAFYVQYTLHMRHYIFRWCSPSPTYKDTMEPFTSDTVCIFATTSFAGVHHLPHRKIQWGLYVQYTLQMLHYVFRWCSPSPTYKDTMEPLTSDTVCIFATTSFAGVHHLPHRKIQWGLLRPIQYAYAPTRLSLVFTISHIERSNVHSKHVKHL